MKKILFLSALALGLMTSCSEDELLSSPSMDNNAIAFATKSPGQVKTRAGVTATSISQFTVSAVNEDSSPFFSSVEFKFDGITCTFHSETPYYWPSNASLSFYAISNPGEVELTAENVPQYSYGDWAGETDLVAATVKAGEKAIPYPLTFLHLLSQISVSAEAKDKTEHLTYKLVSVDMETVCDGTYSFADATGGFGSWYIDNASTRTYSFEDALPISFIETGSVASGNTYWNILPNVEGNIKFSVGYQVFQNGKMIADFTGYRAKYCVVEKPGLEMGKKYIYNFQLSRGSDAEITFTTTIVNWETGETVNKEPVDDGPVYVLDSNYTLIAQTRTLNDGIRISSADGRSGNIIKLHDNVNVGDMNIDGTMVNNIIATPIKPVILDLNSFGLLVDGEPMIGEGIQGNSNVTILLNDNGSTPYTNKSKVIGSPIKYLRNFAVSTRAGNWQSLFLPFSAIVSDTYDFGYVRTLSKTSESSTVTVAYNLDDGRLLNANTPYVIRSAEGTINITNPCGELTPAHDAYEISQIGDTNFTIQGCVNYNECMADNVFWVLTNGGKFAKASVGSKQRPYHWVVYGLGD